MSEQITPGDHVEIKAVGVVESVDGERVLVRVHRELVPMIADQCRRLSPLAEIEGLTEMFVNDLKRSIGLEES